MAQQQQVTAPPSPSSSSSSSTPPPIHANPHSFNFNSGAYVVQIPKHHIYCPSPPDIPHSDDKPRNLNSPFRKCFFFVFLPLFFFIIIVIAAVVGGLYLVISNAKAPRFSIVSFLITTEPELVYNISFNVHNVDHNVRLRYKEGGQVSLSLNTAPIASSPYPSFSQPPRLSTVVPIQFQQYSNSQTELPEKLKESMRDHTHKMLLSFSVSITLPSRIKLGMWRRSAKYDVSCQATVDASAQPTRLSSQQCQTKTL